MASKRRRARGAQTKHLILFLAAAAMLAAASSSVACPVCFGETDSPMVKGAEYSILFMMGMTYTLIGGGVATAVFLRRRGRRIAGLEAERRNALAEAVTLAETANKPNESRES